MEDVVWSMLGFSGNHRFGSCSPEYIVYCKINYIDINILNQTQTEAIYGIESWTWLSKDLIFYLSILFKFEFKWTVI